MLNKCYVITAAHYVITAARMTEKLPNTHCYLDDILSARFRELMQKNKPIRWSTVHAEAFNKIKKEICNTVMNHHFDVNLDTRVKCDASHLGLGASLEQDHRGVWKTVAFASRFLNVAELKYSTNDLELLGIVWTLDHFKNY